MIKLHSHHWRRFVPGLRPKAPSLAGDLYSRAQTILAGYVPLHGGKHCNPADFDGFAGQLRARAEREGDIALWLAALAAQGPRAAHAQRSMDKHGGGYQNRQARLLELIDFNDTYVSAVIASPPATRPVFNDYAKSLIDQFCASHGCVTFLDEQWEAITHGLSREIAVYLDAISLGYLAHMTSRREDAMGVDMVITDPATGYRANLDIKTKSSFHFRLIDLEREGRVSSEQRLTGELRGYARVVNGHGSERVHTTLLRIDHESFGDIKDFGLANKELLRQKLAEILQKNHHERTD